MSLFKGLITVICPTFQNLDYLKLFLKGFKNAAEYDREHPNELIIAINGADEQTLKFCLDNNIDYTYQQKLGLYSATNKAAKTIKNGYLYYTSDDVVLATAHFQKIRRWLSADQILIAKWIQPEEAGLIMVPWRNFKRTPHEFQWHDFQDFAVQVEEHRTSVLNFGTFFMKASEFQRIGYDEDFDPWGGGTNEFLYRCFLGGFRKFYLVHDVIAYHFMSAGSTKHKQYGIDSSRIGRLYKEKHNMTPEEMDWVIRASHSL